MAETLYKKALKLITKELDKDAKNVLRECIQEIYDSYGYGIYVEGKLEKIGYLSSSPKASKGKNWYGEEIKGRDAINEYLKNDYSPSGVIDLAVVATMPYAKILEDGGGNLKQSYRVISMSFQKLQNLSKKYNGTVSMIRK